MHSVTHTIPAAASRQSTDGDGRGAANRRQTVTKGELRKFRMILKLEKQLWRLAHEGVHGDCHGEIDDAAHALFRACRSIEHPGWDIRDIRFPVNHEDEG